MFTLNNVCEMNKRRVIRGSLAAAKPDATTEKRHMIKIKEILFPNKRLSIHQAQVKPTQSKDISVT